MNEMISFGAGVNSVAMTIMLVEDGWRGPVVFSDPGSENPETYCYIEYFEREYLKPRGLNITRILPGSPYHKRSPLPLYEYCLDCGIVPFLAVRWCSKEWKVVPLTGWADEHGVTTMLIGFAADEYKRAKNHDGKTYPLIDAGVTRAGCHRIITDAGLSLPVKSGCFFCPGRTISQWRSLYLDHPGLWDKAIAMEDRATAKYGRPITLLSRGSLRQLPERGWADQMQMDLSRWIPCACQL